MRSTWTDERLDDFREHVDQRFDAVDRRLARIESSIEQQNARIDALHRSFTTFATALVVTFGAIAATLLGLLITQI